MTPKTRKRRAYRAQCVADARRMAREAGWIFSYQQVGHKLHAQMKKPGVVLSVFTPWMGKVTHSDQLWVWVSGCIGQQKAKERAEWEAKVSKRVRFDAEESLLPA